MSNDWLDGPLGSLRPITRRIANAVFQFPLTYKLQQDASGVPELVRREIAAWLEHHKDHAGTGVDFGCGAGEYASSFDPVQYVGVESSHRMVARAMRQNPSYKFIYYEKFDTIRYLCRSKPLVVLNGVLHHLPDQFAHDLLSAFAEGGARALFGFEPTPAKKTPAKMMQLFERGEHMRSLEENRVLLAPHVESVEIKTVAGPLFDYLIIDAPMSGGLRPPGSYAEGDARGRR